MSNIKEEFFKNTYSYLLRMTEKNIPADQVIKVISQIKAFVESKCKSITTSQLRNIYSRIISMSDEDLTSLQLIRPKLAYIAARQQNKQAREIVEFFDELITQVKMPEQFRSFKIFFESVVAYRKYYEK
ncbi:MAG: type III-A CRISPR-associated protein Csm2 [Bacteroidales bacterium]|nr:type III-A CRISPR-associated protein Csm2 [Bacteroidales bacterium]